MNLREKVLSGVAWMGSARLLSQLFTWTVTLLVIRLLTPADYGLLAMATVFMGFLSLFGEAGLGAAIVQMRELDDQRLRAIFALVIVVDTLLFLLQYAAAPAVAWFFGEERLTAIVRVLSLQFLLTMFCVIPGSLLERRLDFRRQSMIGLGAAIIGGTTSLLMATAGYGVWALVVGNIVVLVCSTVGLLVAAPFFKWPDFTMKGARESILFGGQITGSRVLWFVYSQADTFIAGKMLGTQILGFYSVAMHLASLPVQRLSSVLNQIAVPAFARAQDDRHAVAVYITKAVRLLSFVSFPVLWGISSIAPEIVTVLLGPKWLPALLPLQVLPLVMPLTIISPLLNSAFQGIGRADVVFSNVLTATLVMPLAFWIGAHWSLLGLSMAWIIGFPIVMFMNARRMVHLVNLTLRDLVAAVLPAALAGAVMYAAVAIARYMLTDGFGELLRMLLLVTIGAVTYAVLAWFANRAVVLEIADLLGLGRLRAA